jgi:hypothetical protein
VQFVDRLLFLVGRKPAGADPLAAGTTRTDGPSDGGPTSNGNDGSSSTAPPGNGGAGSGGTAPGRSSSQRANPQAGSSAQAFPAVLHLEQLDEYRRDGFTGPVGAMSEAAAAQLYSQFRRYEDSLGGTVKGDWRFKVGGSMLALHGAAVPHPCRRGWCAGMTTRESHAGVLTSQGC